MVELTSMVAVHVHTYVVFLHHMYSIGLKQTVTCVVHNVRLYLMDMYTVVWVCSILYM